MVSALQEEERADHAHVRHLRLPLCAEELESEAHAPADAVAHPGVHHDSGGAGTSANPQFMEEQDG